MSASYSRENDMGYGGSGPGAGPGSVDTTVLQVCYIIHSSKTTDIICLSVSGVYITQKRLCVLFDGVFVVCRQHSIRCMFAC